MKAIVYYEGELSEASDRVELVSNIEPKLLQYTIVNTYPHDVQAYTQGLEFYRDTLYEGTGNGSGPSGNKGISSLRKTNYKTGEVIPEKYKYTSIKGFANYAIDGGAATMLDLPLNPGKQLKSLVLKTIANDVVIGLMGITLLQ